MTKKFILLTLLSILCNLQAQMRVHVINVGQGSATLIEFPCAAVLVDTGGETNPHFHSTDSLTTYLNNFFARRTDLNSTLQCVYLTHPHVDHTRGVAALLEPPYVIRNAVTDGLEQGSENSGQVKLHRAAQAGDATATTADDIALEAVNIDEIGSTGLTNAIIDAVNCTGTNPIIKILWGASLGNPGWGSTAFKNPNNHSLVIKFEYGTSSLLITGDLEEPGIQSLLTKYNGSTILDSDIYILGHHGAANGTTTDLLNKVTPKVALIGMGNTAHELPSTAWAHGHPNKEVLEMLKDKITASRLPIQVKAGTGSKTFVDYTVTKAIYGTGWDGHIVMEADNAGNWRNIGEAIAPADVIVIPSTVNINTASVLELESLPGIGNTKAVAIVDYRAAHGSFTTIEQLDNVPGIGPATINLVRGFIRI